MTDYNNSKIYSIKSFKTDKIYIGSTSTLLNQRLSKHKNNYKSWNEGKYHYVTSFEIIKHGDYYIELIENYPCKSKSELEKREGELIWQNDNTINKCIAGRQIKIIMKIIKKKSNYKIKNTIIKIKNI